ncbi:hypothetical protein SESBI_21005 [Sesbania bispinosa]|nr:hypothetical protein SESBI_21005 [Sesbania bispinosa]
MLKRNRSLSKNSKYQFLKHRNGELSELLTLAFFHPQRALLSPESLTPFTINFTQNSLLILSNLISKAFKDGELQMTIGLNPTRHNKGKRAGTKSPPPEPPFNSTKFRDAKAKAKYEFIKNSKFIEKRKVEIPYFKGRLQPDEFVDDFKLLNECLNLKKSLRIKKGKIVIVKLKKHASIWWWNLKKKHELDRKRFGHIASDCPDLKVVTIIERVVHKASEKMNGSVFDEEKAIYDEEFTTADHDESFVIRQSPYTAPTK